MNRRTCLLSLAALAVTGCADALRRTPPERRHYVIEAAPATAGNPVILPGARLKVRPLRVSPRYEGREFVYRTGDLSFESDYYNLFFVPPTANVTAEAKKRLAGAGLFGAVLDASSQVEATHVLEGAVQELYGDFRNPGSPKAVLELRLLLLTDERLDFSIVFQREYRREVPLSASSPKALAAGYSSGLTDILAQFEADLRNAVAGSGT